MSEHEEHKFNYLLPIGISLGVAFGTIFDNLSLGISLGVCFGLSSSLLPLFGKKDNKKK